MSQKAVNYLLAEKAQAWIAAETHQTNPAKFDKALAASGWRGWDSPPLPTDAVESKGD